MLSVEVWVRETQHITKGLKAYSHDIHDEKGQPTGAECAHDDSHGKDRPVFSATPYEISHSNRGRFLVHSSSVANFFPLLNRN